MSTKKNNESQIAFVITSIPLIMNKELLRNLASTLGEVQSIFRKHGEYSFLNFKKINCSVEEVIAALKAHSVDARLKYKKEAAGNDQKERKLNKKEATESVQKESELVNKEAGKIQKGNKRQFDKKEVVESNQVEDLPKCVLCRQPASKICARCSAYYCSTKCQVDDWQDHRTICLRRAKMSRCVQARPFAVPEVSSDDGICSDASENYAPPDGCIITLTAIKSINMVYARLSDRKACSRHQQIVKRVDELARRAALLKTAPAVDSMAAAKCKQEGLLGRVRVVRSQGDGKVKVKFVDFGTEDVLVWTDLRVLPRECLHFESLVFGVRLLNIKHVRNLDALQLLWSLKNEQFKVTKDGDSDAYELVRLKTGEHLNSKIAALLDVKKPVLRAPFPIQLLPIGQNVRVHILDNSLIKLGLIAACEESQALNLERLSQTVQKHADQNREAYSPQSHEYCLAKSPEDELWYRAQVLEVLNEDSFLVCYIDFGHEAVLRSRRIRYYPAELTEPCRTSRCLIDGLPEFITEEARTRLQDLFAFSDDKTLPEVVSHDGGFVVIKDDAVIETLRKEGIF